MTSTIRSVYEALSRCYESGHAGILVTVVHKEGSGPAAVGAKMFIRPGLPQIGTVGGGALENLAIKECLVTLENGRSSLKNYSLNDDQAFEGHLPTGMLCGGKVTLFYEYLAPGQRVYIFGGGHIGRAVVHHLSTGAWYISVIDQRPEITGNFSLDCRLHSIPPLEFIKESPLPSSSSFVIATHSHQLDFQIALALFKADIQPRYIGLIASRRKAGIFLKELAAELPENTDFSVLYTPIGLDIGGNTPAEIALSIVSQIQAVRHGRPGSHLRIQRQTK